MKSTDVGLFSACKQLVKSSFDIRQTYSTGVKFSTHLQYVCVDVYTEN